LIIGSGGLTQQERKTIVWAHPILLENIFSLRQPNPIDYW
jgi:hypothetical protein